VKELQPIPPFRGQWQRGFEHETMLELKCLGHTIKLSKSPGAGDEVERWLVETLHLWPHPDAPVSPDETDYPTWRNRQYARLMAGKDSA
jgi:hypothetical protein